MLSHTDHNIDYPWEYYVNWKQHELFPGVMWITKPVFLVNIILLGSVISLLLFININKVDRYGRNTHNIDVPSQKQIDAECCNLDWPDNADNVSQPSLQFDIDIEECNSSSTFIFVAVISAVENYDRRHFIRSTWASPDQLSKTKLRVIFVLGSTTNSSLQGSVENESLLYGDLIQTHIIDSYRNLTYKTIAALTWFSNSCQSIPWMLKIDDDVVLNPFKLKWLLEERSITNNQTIELLGRLMKHPKTHREGKWSVTQEEYPFSNYPPFILGSAYIIGRLCVERMLETVAKSKRILWLEDVFITGFVASKAGCFKDSIEVHFRVRAETKRNRLQMVKKTYQKHIFYIGYPAKAFAGLWKNILSKHNFHKHHI